MYIVVFRTIVECTSKGAITWSSFKNKEVFDKWYDEKMKSWYQVVEEGTTQERAIELCSSPEATEAALMYKVRQLGELLRQI